MFAHCFPVISNKITWFNKDPSASLAHFDKYKKYGENLPRRSVEVVTLAWEDCDIFEWHNGSAKIWSTVLEIVKSCYLESEGFLLLKVD